MHDDIQYFVQLGLSQISFNTLRCDLFNAKYQKGNEYDRWMIQFNVPVGSNHSSFLIPAGFVRDSLKAQMSAIYSNLIKDVSAKINSAEMLKDTFRL